MSPRVAASPVHGLPLIQCVRCVMLLPPGWSPLPVCRQSAGGARLRVVRERGPPPPVTPSGAAVAGIMPVMMIGVGLDARLGLSFDQLRGIGLEAKVLGFESLGGPAG